MSAPPNDDLPVIGGVWVGPDPVPPPAPPPKPRPPHTRPVLIGGSALVLAGALAGFFTGPQPLAPLLGIAVGIAFSALAYLLLTRPPRPAATPRPEVSPGAVAPPPEVPMPVLYTPAPRPQTPAQREADELEETLMQMCQQDEKLFERLVESERQRHPRKPRRELIRLAIEHFWRGHH